MIERHLTGISVVVLKGDADELAILVQRLETMGACAVAARSAEAAFASIREARPDVVVCLLSEPTDDEAFAFIASLRGNQATARIPAVAIRDERDQAAHVKIRAAGFQRQVAKPFKNKALSDAIQQAIVGGTGPH